MCKTFRNVCGSDDIWKKFVMTSPGIELPEEGMKDSFIHMWKNCIMIGKERWYSVVLPDLVKYEDELRKEEMQRSTLASESKLVVYHRLNPIYPLSTDCVDDEKSNDPALVEFFEYIFNQFGFVDDISQEEIWDDDVVIKDGKSCRLWSSATVKYGVMLEVVYNLESVSILNPDSDICVDISGEKMINCVNSRLNEVLFRQIAAIVDKSKNYAFYPCNYGSVVRDAYTSSFMYSRNLFVGDEFAIFSVRHFPPTDPPT